jgi:hypothetical protein
MSGSTSVSIAARLPQEMMSQLEDHATRSKMSVSMVVRLFVGRSLAEAAAVPAQNLPSSEEFAAYMGHLEMIFEQARRCIRASDGMNIQTKFWLFVASVGGSPPSAMTRDQWTKLIAAIKVDAAKGTDEIYQHIDRVAAGGF